MHWMCTINSKYNPSRIRLRLIRNGSETNTATITNHQALIIEFLQSIPLIMITIMEDTDTLVENGEI